MQVPKYMKYFRCIGSACEDNCCIGWDVDIDKTTYIKYQKVTHPLMQRELKRYVKINPEVYSDSINYAFAMLTPEKHCSFLNADRLCMIQKHLGEDYLSNVCDSFPRITNKIDGRIERSATPSCPEIMRLLAEHPDAMAFESVKDPTKTPIVSFDIKQSDKRFRGTLISNLLEVRNACLDHLEDDSVSLERQLLRLGDFVMKIVELEKNNKLMQLPNILVKTDTVADDTRTTDTYVPQLSILHQEKNKLTENFLEFSEQMISHLEQVGSGDSIRYKALSVCANKGDVTIGYPYYEAFVQAHPHILRNLFRNHIFKNLFPFSEGENAEEALWLLLSRYAMIKRQLIGLAGFQNQLNTERVVEYLQVFSKVIEHHKHFETRTIAAFKSQKMSSKKLMDTIFG